MSYRMFNISWCYTNVRYGVEDVLEDSCRNCVIVNSSNYEKLAQMVGSVDGVAPEKLEIIYQQSSLQRFPSRLSDLVGSQRRAIAEWRSLGPNGDLLKALENARYCTWPASLHRVWEKLVAAAQESDHEKWRFFKSPAFTRLGARWRDQIQLMLEVAPAHEL